MRIIVAFAWVRGRAGSLLGDPVQLPAKRTVDRRLIVGALLFGAGWGLVGFCPGPALVALGMGQSQAIVFVAAMLAGMGLFEWFEARRNYARRGTMPPVRRM